MTPQDAFDRVTEDAARQAYETERLSVPALTISDMTTLIDGRYISRVTYPVVIDEASYPDLWARWADTYLAATREMAEWRDNI